MNLRGRDTPPISYLGLKIHKTGIGSIKNLEVQVGQLAKEMSDHQEGSLFANTLVNPKERCKEIIARSGKKVGLSDGEKNVVGQEESIE